MEVIIVTRTTWGSKNHGEWTTSFSSAANAGSPCVRHNDRADRSRIARSLPGQARRVGGGGDGLGSGICGLGGPARSDGLGGLPPRARRCPRGGGCLPGHVSHSGPQERDSAGAGVAGTLALRGCPPRRTSGTAAGRPARVATGSRSLTPARGSGTRVRAPRPAEGTR